MSVGQRDYVTAFFEILSSSLLAMGRKLKLASLSSELPKKLQGLEGIEFVDSVREADIAVLNVEESCERISEILGEISHSSIVAVLGIVSRIWRCPNALKEMAIAGFTRSLLPIGDGVAIAIRRGYDEVFGKETIEVYRTSFIEGPNPVHYNTAYAIYILAKFVATRRRGAIIEVGTGRGFSTLWLAHVAKETGSRLISIDSRCERVEYAKRVLEALDLDTYAEVLCMDAREYSHSGKDVVLVFIDGRKDEYLEYLEAIEPYLLPGALVLAHNTLSNAHDVKNYITHVYSNPYKSITIATDPAGLTISVLESS